VASHDHHSAMAKTSDSQQGRAHLNLEIDGHTGLTVCNVGDARTLLRATGIGADLGFDDGRRL
jgi:hypothetical protein